MKYYFYFILSSQGPLQSKKFQKSELTMRMGGLVQVSLGILLFLENRPNIAINQY